LVARALIVLALVAGCWNREAVVKYSGSAQLARGGLSGGEAAVTSGVNGVQIGVGAFGQDIVRPMDPNRHFSGGLDFNLRVSLFGLVISGDNHPVEHWFDCGAEVGGGGALASPAGSVVLVGQGYFGAWADFGLWSTPKYPLLVVGIRQIGYGSPWIDATQVSIGLAWGQRWISEGFRD
jgi:hypothetical protein